MQGDWQGLPAMLNGYSLLSVKSGIAGVEYLVPISRNRFGRKFMDKT
jgi:hypothetical protein